MGKLGVALVLLLALAAGGCAPGAKANLSKIQNGMSEDQVAEELGQPESVKLVQFPQQQGKFVVWEYNMVPETPNCPSKMLGRSLAAVCTVGFSEVAISHAEAEPHWVYFEDGKLAFASRAVDCAQYDCRVWPVEVSQVKVDK